eukprot:COSAG01_NODE_734_length_13974_cov_57.831784_8_plen_104_part_00
MRRIAWHWDGSFPAEAFETEQFLKEIWREELLIVRPAGCQAVPVQVEEPGEEGEEEEAVEEVEEMVNDQVNARALQICRRHRPVSLNTLTGARLERRQQGGCR